MNEAVHHHRVLVAGATGQVGSQVVKILLASGNHHVRVLVRRPDSRIMGLNKASEAKLEYAVGSLEDKGSLIKALQGIDTVVSSANGVIPNGKTMSVSSMSSSGYENFISAAEDAGVKHWVQSSVPTWEHEPTLPELAGKRQIEERLLASPIACTIVRNPAFMDIWLVMAGAKQATAKHPHATTKRPYGFQRLYIHLVGDLVVKRGILLAPGGKEHGSPFIASVDVAHMMGGVVGKATSHNRIIEAGGPEWLSWGQVAELFSKKTGRRIQVLKIPAWFARMGQLLIRPFSQSAANILGMVRLVASYQPRWEDPTVVQEFDLPPQTTVAEYLQLNWEE